MIRLHPSTLRGPVLAAIARPLLLVALAVAAVLVAGGAQAGKAPGWARITAANGGNTVQVSLARTRDGVLHVSWLRKNSSATALMHSRLSPGGKPLGSPNAIVSGWGDLTTPTLAVSPDGSLRVFFSGLRSTDSKDPYVSGAVYTATSPASGKSWSLDSGSISKGRAYGSNSVIAGAFTRNGTPAAAWTESVQLGVHIGIDPANPARSRDEVVQTACCSYEPALASDQATGALVLGWFSSARARLGIYTQAVSPIGAPQLAPGSVTTTKGARNALAEDSQTPLVARSGGGLFLAYCSGYPTCRRVLVWRVGSSRAAVVETGMGARFAMLARGPEGRLWVASQKGRLIYARRSNAAATIFGAAVSIRPPHGTGSIYRLQGEGSLGSLDLFAHVGLGASTAASSWVTRVFPGLSLSASTANLSATRGGKVVFRVTDAADPVAGAQVSVRGRSAASNSQGQASLSFPRGRTSYLARAAKPGYTGASLRVGAR